MNYDDKVKKATVLAVLDEINADDNAEHDLLKGLIMAGIRQLNNCGDTILPAVCMSLARLSAAKDDTSALKAVASATLLAMLQELDKLDQDNYFTKYLRTRYNFVLEVAAAKFKSSETAQ